MRSLRLSTNAERPPRKPHRVPHGTLWSLNAYPVAKRAHVFLGGNPHWKFNRPAHASGLLDLEWYDC